MPDQYRGIPIYYDEIMQQLWGTTFYQFKNDPYTNLEPGQVCEAVINYNNDKTFQLEVQSYNKDDEYQTTWKLRPLTTRLPLREQRLQAFNLETNERIILRRAKLRFVILINKIDDDFSNPNIAEYRQPYWIVMPLFAYKESKHSMRYCQ